VIVRVPCCGALASNEAKRQEKKRDEDRFFFFFDRSSFARSLISQPLLSLPLSAAPVLPADFEDSTWLRLKAAVAAIHAQKPSPTTFEDLYRVRRKREEEEREESLAFFLLLSLSRSLSLLKFSTSTSSLLSLPKNPNTKTNNQDVEALCLHGMADRLYARLAAAVDAHVGSELQALAERAKASSTSAAAAAAANDETSPDASSSALFFLPQFDATWRSHCACMLTLRQVFAPLDAATATAAAASRGAGGGGGGANYSNNSMSKSVEKVVSPSSSSAAAAVAAAAVVAARQPLHEAGLALFRAHLSAHPEVATRAAAGLLATVAAERRQSGAAAEAAMSAAIGVKIPPAASSSSTASASTSASAADSPVDRGLAASVSRSLAALSLYQRAFEAPLLAQSDAFYQREGNRLISVLPPALYLSHAERRLAEEAERSLSYLERRTRAPLVKVVEAQLLARHVPALLEAGVPAFFDADLAVADAGGVGGGGGGNEGGGGTEAMATDDDNKPAAAAPSTSSAPAAAAASLLYNRVGITGDGLEDLRRLSAAASRVRASDALRAAFKAHVKSRGEGLMMAAATAASTSAAAAAPADDAATPGAASAAPPSSSSASSKRLIPDLLLLKARADAAVRLAFGSREAFSVALKEAFEGFINRQGGRAAELLAKHVDAELRGGGNAGSKADKASAAAAASETDLDSRLDAALALFRFVEGKDVFEAFYKRDLARRLLLGSGGESSFTADSDAERTVLAKLKVECGAGFTSKLEGMFKDVSLSKELLASFRASGEAARARESGVLPSNLDVSVSVLTAGFWPTYGTVGSASAAGGGGGGNLGARASDATATPAGGAASSSPSFLLPAPLSGAAAAFADHYLQKHRGRRLTWMHELSTAVLRARFDGTGGGGGSGGGSGKPPQSKELVVSLHQASVLLLFNNGDPSTSSSSSPSLSLAQVVEGTGLPVREARMVLASLSLARVRPLIREAAPSGEKATAPAPPPSGLLAAAASISDTDSFRVAPALSSPLFRVRLNAAQLREPSEKGGASDESRRIGEAVDQDRAHAVDAAIVRIMKTRRSLAHKLLARELAAQLRFAVGGPALKKRVESLIDREFLARDEADPSVYNYLA